MTSRSARLLTPDKGNEAENLTVKAEQILAPSGDDEEEELEEDVTSYTFDGVIYATYQEMVDAKRQRNQQKLVDSGLLQTVNLLKKQKAPSKNGIKRRLKASMVTPTTNTRRKSNRIAGVASDGRYVEDERAGKFTLATERGGTIRTGEGGEEEVREPEPEFYRGRINNGEDLTVEEAVNNTGEKWFSEDSVKTATDMTNELSSMVFDDEDNSVEKEDHDSLESMCDAVSVDDDDCVAKLVPDRIYSVATHPSSDKLLVCAGDKTGYVGLWNASNDSTALFKFHSGAAACLAWTPSGRSLMSASYDGTVRVLDVEKQCFKEAFATYDDSEEYADKPGVDMDTGYRYWTQYACIDHRSPESSIFVSTSIGTVMHLDWRSRTKVTFHEMLSEKKINSVSLHTNGHTLLSSGLDCLVQTWDIRKLGDNRRITKSPKPLATYNCGKSVNSAYFSPSGSYVVATTMADRLEIFENAHTATKNKLKPTHSIRHDNRTGRWLSTFMATWHPSQDIFCVGSMRKPRAIEVFSAQGKMVRAIQGDALTAVASRCCFHPSTSRMTIVGGNSSGRVTIVQ